MSWLQISDESVRALILSGMTRRWDLVTHFGVLYTSKTLNDSIDRLVASGEFKEVARDDELHVVPRYMQETLTDINDLED
jgi:hypothetical protein